MDYKETLNLPKTDFPMKANLPQKEPEILKKWEDEKIYEKIIQKNKTRPPFIFHDGPPYANANIHIGTALNKILKDFVVKYKNMTGFQCEFIPGWDCHGLPIELQATKNIKNKEATPLEIRAHCRAHAEKYMDIQRSQFKRLGVLGDWHHPYLTMSYDYEATIVRELATLAGKDLLYRGKKVIHWCAHCRTALAEAEIEYEEKSSPSIYVKFPLDEISYKALSQKFPELSLKKVFVLIWTTTPWTLPANLAIALHPEFSYVAFEENSEVYIVAEVLLDSVKKECGLTSGKILCRFKAQNLKGFQCDHPFLPKKSVILEGHHVTEDSGTGCVHTAPGHGEEDYFLGLKHHLPIFSPVNHRGQFTHEMPDYEGQFVFDTNPLIIERLKKADLLLKSTSITHSYPHCWRCKKPVLFRATKQWFVPMDKQNLRKNALSWIDKVEFLPSWGKNRIRSMMETRPDWCLSRQRVWGVPIPALHCKKCLAVFIDEKFMRMIADYVEKEGSDFWFKTDLKTILPKHIACQSCGSQDFEKETDILDVWFDSGCSFSSVLGKRKNIYTADLYLEGSDQHRGWFHTSLLISMATRNMAPYKTVLTHGFVVDQEGRKMSKSLGNVVEPEKIISQYGAEILRLWVASEDYRDDVHCSEPLINRITESYRKIRNTCKHMLGNLDDFDPKKDHVSYDKLLDIDQWALLKLHQLIDKITRAYDHYEFHTVFQLLNNFCVVELSSIYLDILKDRLYTFSAKGVERRAAQTVLYEILSSLTKLMAPILSFTAEEIFSYLYPQEKSIYLTDFPKVNPKYLDSNLEKRWEKLLELRALVSKALEEARQKKLIGNALEAKVILHVTPEWWSIQSCDLSTFFIVSQVILNEVKNPPFKIEVTKASGQKCERCWIWSESVTTQQSICDKCKKQI